MSMSRFPTPLLVLCIGSAAIASSRAISRSQSQTSPRTIVAQRTVSPLQRGINPTNSHAPNHADRRRQSAIRSASMTVDRMGASGAAYVPGRVIVKFKDGTSTTARVAAMSLARTAGTAPAITRPTYANFDVMAIDAAEDPEAIAESLRQSAAVEYAQAAYRVHAQFVPNDGFYARQWNLPLINLERAWDLQPAAGSAMTIAVLDTGIAYMDATVAVHASAFTDEDGVLYPALGDLTLRFVAATELGSSSRFVNPYDFIWNDASPIDLDGHGTRQRHARSAHEQRAERHGRHV
jgi:subtilisin family serine protease